MGQFYEVQFAKRLDGSDQHGNVTDSVKFTTEEETALWTHKPETQITPGQKAYGRIDTKISAKGNQYRKFVREQLEEGQPQASQELSPAGKAAELYINKNSDGMRQGMSINNASALMVAFIKAGFYTNADTDQLISDLEALARMIYKIDLTAEPTISDEQISLSGDPGSLDDVVSQFFPDTAPVTTTTNG